MRVPKSQPDRDTLYSAPSAETFLALAALLCQQWEETPVTMGVVQGLAEFLQIAGDIQAKQASKKRKGFDNAAG